MPAGRRIFYLTPDDNRPIGGIRVIYRHVDILRQHGEEAFVLHTRPGFRATWFDHQTPSASLANTLIARDDLVVFPDVLALEARTRFAGVRKVIFNQGFFLTFAHEPPEAPAGESPYRHPDVIGILVNSAAGEAFLMHALPGARVFRVRVSVDPSLFRFQQKKRPQIAFMPRRNPQDLSLILNTLKHRGVLAGAGGIVLAPIDNLPQAQAAAVLRDSLFFLSASAQEGFALPPAEAMACGCVVVGYDGFGGGEYLTHEHAFPVPASDAWKAVQSLEEVISAYARDPRPLDALRQRAAEFIARTYSPQAEQASVVEAWTQILRG